MLEPNRVPSALEVLLGDKAALQSWFEDHGWPTGMDAHKFVAPFLGRHRDQYARVWAAWRERVKDPKARKVRGELRSADCIWIRKDIWRFGQFRAKYVSGFPGMGPNEACLPLALLSEVGAGRRDLWLLDFDTGNVVAGFTKDFASEATKHWWHEHIWLLVSTQLETKRGKRKQDVASSRMVATGWNINPIHDALLRYVSAPSVRKEPTGATARVNLHAQHSLVREFIEYGGQFSGDLVQELIAFEQETGAAPPMWLTHNYQVRRSDKETQLQQ